MIRPLFPIVLLFLALAANAQDRTVLSPFVSFEIGAPLFLNRTAGVLDPVSGLAAGTSSRESFGIGAQLSAPSLFTQQLGILAQLQGIYSSGYFQFNAGNYSLSGIDRKLLGEISALWSAGPLAVRAGPWISQALSRTIYENDSTGKDVTPQNAASNPTHFGLSAGISFQIADFPIRPELTSHLDLTELSHAAGNAWSAGLSLVYTFGTRSESAIDSLPVVPVTLLPPIETRVRFLVNGAEAHGVPPLERVELRIEQYEMPPAAGERTSDTVPRLTQWIEESYRLPQLALQCSFDRQSEAYLMILNDSLRLFEHTFPKTLTTGLLNDTTIDLDADSTWQSVLGRLNTVETNSLVAELRTGGDKLYVARDTLRVPPADTSRTVRSILNKQMRFKFLDESNAIELHTLLDRLRRSVGSAASVILQEPISPSGSAANQELLKRVESAIGIHWKTVRHEPTSDLKSGAIVILNL